MRLFLSTFLYALANILPIAVVLLMALAVLSWRLLRAGVGLLAAAIVTGYFLAVPALAAEDTLLHIPQAMWNEINELLVGLFLALGVMLWKWIDAHSPLKNSQAEQIARDAFKDLLDKGAAYGMTQLKGVESKVGGIDVGHPAIAAAANFVILQGPGLAKRLGVDVSTEQGRAAVIRSVTLRVGELSGTGDGHVIRTSGDSTLTIPQKAAPAVIALPASVSLVGAPDGEAKQPQ